MWLTLVTLTGPPLMPFHRDQQGHGDGASGAVGRSVECPVSGVCCDNGWMVLTAVGEGTFGLRCRGDLGAKGPILSERYVGARKEWSPTGEADGTVRVARIYDGVDLLLKPRAAGLVRLLRIAPLADPSQIAVALQSGLPLRVNRCGLIEVVPGGQPPLTVVRPIAYQDVPAGRHLVDVALLFEKDRYRLDIGDYDRSDTLFVELRTF